MSFGQTHTDEWAVNLGEYFAQVRRDEFPWSDEQVFLDHAALGPFPLRTTRVLNEFNRRRSGLPLITDAEVWAMLDDARRAAAEFIGARDGEIALIHSTSYGVSAAAAALAPLARGRIVLSGMEFPANIYPWKLQTRSGSTVEIVPPLANGWPDEQGLLDRVDAGGVGILAISWVQFATGYRMNLNELGEACRARDTLFVVDGIQGAGQLPLDVSRTPIDVFVTGGQKWLLSPWGSGFMYIRRDLLDRVEPAFAGWTSFSDSLRDDTKVTYGMTYVPGARRFEMGTVPFQDALGMTVSLRFIADLGLQRIADHLRRLRDPLVELAETGRIEIVSPLDRQRGTGITAVRTPDTRASFDALVHAGIRVALREGSIRISPHCYNTRDEIARVADILWGARD